MYNGHYWLQYHLFVSSHGRHHRVPLLSHHHRQNWCRSGQKGWSRSQPQRDRHRVTYGDSRWPMVTCCGFGLYLIRDSMICASASVVLILILDNCIDSVWIHLCPAWVACSQQCKAPWNGFWVECFVFFSIFFQYKWGLLRTWDAWGPPIGYSETAAVKVPAMDGDAIALDLERPPSPPSWALLWNPPGGIATDYVLTCVQFD